MYVHNNTQLFQRINRYSFVAIIQKTLLPTTVHITLCLSPTFCLHITAATRCSLKQTITEWQEAATSAASRSQYRSIEKAQANCPNKAAKKGRQQTRCPFCCLPMKKTIAYYEKDFNLPQICSRTLEAPRRQPRQSVAG